MQRKQKTNMQLQKQQIQLFNIQKQVEDTMGKINEAINALKVEELHLRSITIKSSNEAYQQRPEIVPQTSVSKSIENLDAIAVNAQAIDLNVVLQSTALNNAMEEEDD